VFRIPFEFFLIENTYYHFVIDLSTSRIKWVRETKYLKIYCVGAAFIFKLYMTANTSTKYSFNIGRKVFVFILNLDFSYSRQYTTTVGIDIRWT